MTHCDPWQRWIAKCTYGLLGYSDRVVASLARKCALTYAESGAVACQGGFGLFCEEETPSESSTYVADGNPSGLLH